MKTLHLKKTKESAFRKCAIILTACFTLCIFKVNAQYNVSASSGSINVAVPDNSLTGATTHLTLSGAGAATIDANCVVSATVSVTTTSNADVDMYLVGPSGCGTLELSTDNGSSGSNYTGATFVTPSGAANINTLTGPTNNISGIWKAEGSYNVASAQTVLFDFDNYPVYSPFPINLTVSGVTAQFSATGSGYSIQNSSTLGWMPVGLSGHFICPSSVFAADLLISFDHTLTNFSILYACQELGCDDAATMRVTARMNGTLVGTNTKTASNPGTWPVDLLSCNFPQGFNSVVVHYASPPPTCQDYGPIFMADQMTVTALNTPSALASGTGGGSYVLPVTAISGCPVNGSWSLFVGDDAAGNITTIHSFALNITNNISPVLNLKLFIEGFYSAGGQMRPRLYTAGMCLDPAAADSITVELHNSTSPYSTFASAKALLLTDGSAQVQFPNSVLNNSYYIVIRHHNALETWSSVPEIITNNMLYDFTTAASSAYGYNLCYLTDGNFALYSGDVNQDGTIDILDMSIADNDATAFAFGYNASDCNGDGSSDILDMAILDNNANFFLFVGKP